MRYIEIDAEEFYQVVNACVRASLDGDSVIYFVEDDSHAEIGAEPFTTPRPNGLVFKHDIDFVIDVNTKENWRDLIGEKVYEYSKKFVEWSEQYKEMKIIVVNGNQQLDFND